MSADPDRVSDYHAHVYFDSATRDTALQVREAIGARFDVRLGRVHDRPVGPHPKSMYQVAFPAAEFARLVPWLMLNRQALDVLVHPETGDDVADHTRHALWLGDRLPLDISVLMSPST
jgi:aromatic ring-cleaving dioxygenase